MAQQACTKRQNTWPVLGFTWTYLQFSRIKFIQVDYLRGLLHGMLPASLAHCRSAQNNIDLRYIRSTCWLGMGTAVKATEDLSTAPVRLRIIWQQRSSAGSCSVILCQLHQNILRRCLNNGSVRATLFRHYGAW